MVPPIGFLDLSAELRNLVYGYCLASNNDIHPIYQKHGPKSFWIFCLCTSTKEHSMFCDCRSALTEPKYIETALLFVDTFVKNEALRFLFGKNRIVVTTGTYPQTFMEVFKTYCLIVKNLELRLPQDRATPLRQRAHFVASISSRFVGLQSITIKTHIIKTNDQTAARVVDEYLDALRFSRFAKLESAKVNLFNGLGQFKDDVLRQAESRAEAILLLPPESNTLLSQPRLRAELQEPKSASKALFHPGMVLGDDQ